MTKINTGIKIRNTKIKNNNKRCQEIRPEQEDICRFVTINYQIIKKVNGKYRRTGSKTENGLQIRNRVYLTNGKYKMVNNRGLKIKQVFDLVPEWATEQLIEKYNEFTK